MGCDIRLHVEVGLRSIWEHFAAPNVPRNYELFGLMAGVRGDDPIVKPRGLPNCSHTTRFMHAFQGSDEHNASWLNIDEIKLLKQEGDKVFPPIRPGLCWFDSCFGYFFGNSYYDWPEGQIRHRRWASPMSVLCFGSLVKELIMECFNFSEALRRIRNDRKVARKDWRLRKGGLQIESGDPNAEDYLYVTSDSGRWVPYIPCHTDLLACDWYEIT